MIERTGRRQFLGGAAALGGLAMLAGCGADGPVDRAGADGRTLPDLRDRPVHIPEKPARLAIDDGRYLIALSLIHPDPVSLLAAWSGDVNRISPEIHDAFVARFPGLRTLPKVQPSNLPFAVEPVLASRPDIALISLGSTITDAQVAQVEGAGVGVAFIDFFSHPFENQAESLALLGALTGRQAQAASYNDFRRQRLDRIAARVRTIAEKDRPTVFLEPHAGITPDCCNSPGRGNVGDHIAFAGGRNIGADRIAQPSGKLSLEYVIERDPDIYIATGGPHLAKSGGFVVGPGFTPAAARSSLSRVVARPGIASLKAVREGRVHGLSHQLVNSPIDVVAVEALARWIHPALFADIDPAATLAEINRRFLAVPYRGAYWVDLRPA